jgi:L-threonylcarbamoyladenylate synthase
VKLGEASEKETIKEAVGVLLKGGVVVYPTETSYAIGADALNAGAVERVHEAKKQPKSKPVSVIVASEEQAEEIAQIEADTRRLIHNFMPGPLTLLCPKKRIVPQILSREGIAFRIPANRFARALAKELGRAITATSANIHGREALFSAKEAEQRLGKKVDLIVDAGQLPKREASTIFSVMHNKLLRKGPIKREQIEKVLGHEIKTGKKG